MKFEKFSASVIEQLQSYVYVYIDPRTEKPFYIGKGKGNRCFDHLVDLGKSKKSQRISEINALNATPQIDILAFGLTESEALIVEAATIDLIGKENLDNEVRGHDSSRYGRRTVDDIRARLSVDVVNNFDQNVALIRINKTYDPSFNELQLYEATRGIWEIAASKREKVQFACAVFDGIIREVYEISGWFDAGTTMYGTRSAEGFMGSGRFEFVGKIAEIEISKKYRNKKISTEILPFGFAGSIRFVGPDFN